MSSANNFSEWVSMSKLFAAATSETSDGVNGVKQGDSSLIGAHFKRSQDGTRQRTKVIVFFYSLSVFGDCSVFFFFFF